MKQILSTAALCFASCMLQAQSGSTLYSRLPDPGQTNGTVWLAANDGSLDQQITDGAWPRLSPDGRYVLFHRGANTDVARQDVYVLDLATGEETRVYANNDFVVFYDWTADSSQIVFDYMCGIYQMNADGSNIRTLIQADCYDDAPSLSPADGTIAFHNQFQGIMLADPDGGNRARVPNTQPGDFWPSWSPDGQWISFARSLPPPSILADYYVIRPDGTDLTQLTFSSAPDGFRPRGAWSPDAFALVAPGVVDGVLGLYAISTDGSGTVTYIPTADGNAVDFTGSVFDFSGGGAK